MLRKSNKRENAEIKIIYARDDHCKHIVYFLENEMDEGNVKFNSYKSQDEDNLRCIQIDIDDFL